MYKLQRCQKIPPSTVVGNTISNAGGKVLIVIDYSAKHQYTDTIATPGRAPAHLISIKISLSSPNSCWSEQSTRGQGEQWHRSSVQVALAVLPLLAMRQETGQGYFESFPTFLA